MGGLVVVRVASIGGVSGNCDSVSTQKSDRRRGVGGVWGVRWSLILGMEHQVSSLHL